MATTKRAAKKIDKAATDRPKRVSAGFPDATYSALVRYAGGERHCPGAVLSLVRDGLAERGFLK
jgi:hypothetical protein